MSIFQININLRSQYNLVDFLEKSLIELKNYLYLLSQTKNQVWIPELYYATENEVPNLYAFYNKHTIKNEGQMEYGSNKLTDINAHLSAGICHL